MTTGTSTRLAVTDVGAGSDQPTLLFVPGWCGDRSVFDDLLPLAAARGRRVVSVDLPDHGASPAVTDFTTADVVDDLVSTLDALEVGPVVPVALSHAGWVAIGLRRALGPVRVPAVVLLDWMVLGTPPGFADALDGLQSPAWADVRTGLTGMWTDGLDVPPLRRYVDSMCSYGERHWQRAGREIHDAFAREPVPVAALEALQPCPTLHLYAQPGDQGYLSAQQTYAVEHPWFEVHRLDARSHFPMFEVPGDVVERIVEFVATT